MTAWRIVKTRHADTAFDGEGARRFGGRFNHPGVAVVYVASALSLAILELLVHVDRSKLLERYVAFPVTFEAELLLRLDFRDLPSDWNAPSVMNGSQRVGDAWVREAASAVLQVPSALLPEKLFTSEHNYLINPHHVDFSQVEIGKPLALPLDARLGG